MREVLLCQEIKFSASKKKNSARQCYHRPGEGKGVRWMNPNDLRMEVRK